MTDPPVPKEVNKMVGGLLGGLGIDPKAMEAKALEANRILNSKLDTIIGQNELLISLVQPKLKIKTPSKLKKVSKKSSKKTKKSGDFL